MIARYGSICGLFLILAIQAVAAGEDRPAPSPEQIRSRLHLDPGLKIELVAAEPEITSPVAIAFDEQGRLWVVEMRDYPNGPAPGHQPEGRIRVLEDKDGDGRFETSTVYADGLLFANGVLPWKGGLVVTAAPHIVRLNDKDGDGRADEREVLFEGFTAKNPQLRVSHPNLGLDGWIYVANGLRGGSVIRSGERDAKPLDLSGRDFRFDLVHDRYEAISGMGQYGLTFDDWGHRFVCDNRHHLRHVVLPESALKRNPYLAVAELVEDVSELELGAGGGGAKLHPLSANWTTSSMHTGRFTAACSVFIYRGGLLGEAYQGAAFTCDPTANLVHMERLRPSGATFRSKPARDDAEFLASPDDSFRPVFLAHGPDGALYVVDMARAVIEHPEFMPVELKNRPDLTAGKDRGRIWRIVPEQSGARPRPPHLRDANIEVLVSLLGHPNAWWRTTIERLLIERQDRSADGVLRAIAANRKAPPLPRLHAAWLLAAAGKLDEELILALLKDPHAGLRENAIEMAATRVEHSPAIQSALAKMADDADGHVRFQLALALGGWDDDRVLDPLAKLALAGDSDRWTRIAVACAVPQRAGALLARLLPTKGEAPADRDRLTLIRELAALVGARREPHEVAHVIEHLLALDPKAANWQRAGLAGLAEGMATRGGSLAVYLTKLADAGITAEQARALNEGTNALMSQAAALAADAAADHDERLVAIGLLAQAPWATAQPALAKLMGGDSDQTVRQNAVRALAAKRDDEAGPMLLDAWPAATPAVRREILSALLRQPARTSLLLDVLEAHKIRPGDIDVIAAKQLQSHADKALRERARKLLAAGVPEERKQVIERFKAALAHEGDLGRGRAVFQKTCATCHHVGEVGVDVGPDIADTRVKTKEALLNDILNPNGAIDGNYVEYVVSLRDGRVLNGIIAAESASSVTLKRAENQTDVLLRQDIEELRSTGNSLMPEGLEKNLTVADMADLLTFLKNWRYGEAGPPGSTSGK